MDEHRPVSQNARIHMNRVDKNREKERKENNMKLVKKIFDINTRNGLLQNMDVEARRKMK